MKVPYSQRVLDQAMPKVAWLILPASMFHMQHQVSRLPNSMRALRPDSID